MENVEDMELGQLDGLDVPEGAGQLLLPQVVVREILENLCSTDCLNLSRVNKVWRNEALRVFRDRGSLTAKMNTADGKCKDLRAFASDLRRMKEVRKVVPFSGLTISINGVDSQHGDWCEESEAGELDQIYDDILHQMDWKHFTIDLSGYSVESKNCAGFQLAMKILQNRSCSLKELSLEIGLNHEAKQIFIRNWIQDYNLLSLRTLEFGGLHCEDLIKALVSRAPNLKVMYTKGLVDIYANLLEGSSALHVLDIPFRVPENANVPESILGQLRLRELHIRKFNLRRLDMIRRLLHDSRKTLGSMEVDAVALVLLIHFGICLENVRELNVKLSVSDVTQPRSKRLLKSVDFTHIFPNLSSVLTIYDTCDDPEVQERTWNAVTGIVDQGNAAFVEPSNRNRNIKELSFDIWCTSIPDSFTRFLVQMFPKIEKLFIETEALSNFGRFCDHWVDLVELDVTMRVVGDVVENLDSVLCGIFPQEVAQLRERDEEYLQNVNIVPVMPSLMCFNRLKTFDLRFCQLGFFEHDATTLISKVTRLIPFRRRPDLTVTLETYDCWMTRELRRA